MKRDMDLIRNILLRFEESTETRHYIDSIEELADDESIIAHLQMLKDAGFLDRQILQPLPNSPTRIDRGWRITWAGHEFIDSIRDPDIWRQTKAGAEKVGSWSVKILADLASGFIRAKAQDLGLPLT